MAQSISSKLDPDSPWLAGFGLLVFGIVYVVGLPGIILVALVFAYQALVKRRGWWCKATSEFLAALIYGVAAVCLLVVVLKVSHLALRRDVLREYEGRLVGFTLWLRRETRLSLRIFLPTVSALALLSIWIPRWRPASHFFMVKSFVSKAVIALTAAASFSFFSHEIARDAHRDLSKDASSLVSRYEAVLRLDWKRVGESLAADRVADALESMSAEDSTAYANMFILICSDSSWAHGSAQHSPLIRRPVVLSLANYACDVATADRPASSDVIDHAIDAQTLRFENTLLVLRAPAQTGDEWRNQQQQVDALENELIERERDVEQAEQAARECVVALKETFAEVVSAGVGVIADLGGLSGEDVRGLARDYIECVVERLSKTVLLERIQWHHDPSENELNMTAGEDVVVRAVLLTRVYGGSGRPLQEVMSSKVSSEIAKTFPPPRVIGAHLLPPKREGRVGSADPDGSKEIYDRSKSKKGLADGEVKPIR